MRKVLTALAVISGLGLSSAQAALLLDDNFNNEPIAVPASSLMNFDIVSGSVDVVGDGSSFVFYPGNGRYLDLDGTSGTQNTPASVIQSKMSFGPGTYLVSFQLGGSQRSQFGDVANTTVVSLGNVSNPYTLLSTDNLTTISFLATITGSSKLTFTESGPSDNIGNILDNVRVSSVPLPASAPLFGAALVALGGFGYAAKRKKAVSA